MEEIEFQGIKFSPIPNYDRYYASRCGKIYSGKGNRIAKTCQFEHCKEAWQVLGSQGSI
jgi:hypothetical protein